MKNNKLINLINKWLTNRFKVMNKYKNTCLNYNHKKPCKTFIDFKFILSRVYIYHKSKFTYKFILKIIKYFI